MITRGHVQSLLQSKDDDPVLIVLAGQAMVVAAGELGDGHYDGAVEVISRDDLVAQLADDLATERDVDMVASQLDAMVTQLGS